MILDEIVNEALDETRSLSQLLRKCLVLANQLKNEQLKAWANQELEGYKTSQDVPDYRVVNAPAAGNFSGYGGAAMNNFPIPPGVLKLEHRSRAQKVKLMQSVSAYEEAVRKNTTGVVYFAWPGDLVLYYQERLMESYNLVSANQHIPISSVVEILNAVRNRTLKLTLEIQNELPDSRDIKAIPADHVQEIVVHQIFGGNNIIGSSGSSISIAPALSGDRRQLNHELKKAGLSDNDLNDLTSALSEKGSERLGQRVQHWITAVAPKVVTNGVKYGADVAKPFLTEMMRKYLENPHRP